MKTYFFHSSIGESSDQKLFDFLNENEGSLKIFLCSDGGNVCSAHAILDALNARSEEIELVASGELCSAAFFIFFSFKGKRRVLDGSTGMYHFSGITSRITVSGKASNPYDRFRYELLERERGQFLLWMEEIGLTQEEISKVDSNEEVYFSTERLRELIN